MNSEQILSSSGLLDTQNRQIVHEKSAHEIFFKSKALI